MESDWREGEINLQKLITRHFSIKRVPFLSSLRVKETDLHLMYLLFSNFKFTMCDELPTVLYCYLLYCRFKLELVKGSKEFESVIQDLNRH